MSFFVKASVEALKLVPQINAEVRGHDIVYRNYHDIGIAVGGGKGLVVPVIRNAERLSFAEIESTIAEFARSQGVTQIYMGRSRPRPWWRRFSETVVQQVVRQSRDMQVTIVAERRR